VADVLIVDDDVDAAEALREVMDLEGHSVRVAYNGQEGLAALGARLPDVVLLDVEMPVLDGPGMADEMLVHNLGFEGVPIVLLSGVPNLARIAKQVGTPYVLGKPFRYERLTTVVDTALRERRAPVPPLAT
jgi:DNA-binding NtrC family response regulator